MAYWYRFFVCIMTLNLLASCLPILDQQLIITKKKLKSKHKGEEGDFFEGDIRLIDVSEAEKRDVIMQELAVKGLKKASPSDVSGNLWPDGIVYFAYDDNIYPEYKSTFAQAIDIFQEKTCLDFQNIDLIDDNVTSYLNFTDTFGCSSYIGRTGKMQEVSITSNCDSIGHAIHEIGHAVGLWHEHTRTDRNNYVKIIWDNIESSNRHNFYIYSHPNVPNDIAYDFESVMHYKNNAFSIDKVSKKTIEIISKNKPDCLREKMGQRVGLSFRDALKLNRMYNCTEKLELQKNETDPCPLPSPTTTPTPAPTSMLPISSVIPSPTPAAPGCKIKKALKSGETGEAISFPFHQQSSLYLGCPSNCLQSHCNVSYKDIFRVVSCLQEYFYVYLVSNRKNRYIKSGDTIAFKSLKREDHWIDCSRGNCTLTKCDSNSKKNDITNFTRDICNQHQFKIYAVGKEDGKRIKSKEDLVYFKFSTKYLNCLGKQCRLISEGSDNEGLVSGASGIMSERQYFAIEKPCLL